MSIIRKVFVKKVSLSEVADPKPSLIAGMLINDALKQAYLDQKNLREQAAVLRGSH